jgi:hypothetical protein
MTEQKKQMKPLAVIGSVVGMIGGWTFSQYCGACIWIPGGMAFLIMLFFVKTPLHPKWFRAAISVIGGHLAWFIVACAMSGKWQAVIFDIVLLFAGIIWLWLRPGIAPVVYLGLVEVASLASNVFVLSSTHFGDMVSRAITAHIVFRVLAIICLVGGLIKMRRDLAAPDPAVTILSDERVPPNA